MKGYHFYPFLLRGGNGRKKEALDYTKTFVSCGHHVSIFLLSGNELNWPRIAKDMCETWIYITLKFIPKEEGQGYELNN